jgi:hypothetical protein
LAIIRSIKKPFRYTLEKERGTESPGVFVLKPMSVEVERYLTGIRLQGRKACDSDIVKAALISWENIPVDENGTLAKIKRDLAGLVEDETLNLLALDERAELAAAVLDGGALSEADEKNSEPSSDNTPES